MPPRLLPLFPLPIVLFPGATLPLHIFEPRYRTMLADCLAGDRLFGLIFRPEGAAERALERGRVGCTARIEQNETLPDGRSNIVVRGVERFVFARFGGSDHPYHVAEVEGFVDEAEPREPLASLADDVRAVFDRVRRAAHTIGDDARVAPALPDDPGQLSFAVASMLELDAPARQRLLASSSPTGRLRELEGMLAGAVGTLEARAATHTRAKANGRGTGAAY